VTREVYIQRGRVLLMGGKGSEDLVEILRITSANIIQELSDYYPPTLACYSTAKRMHTTSVPPSVKPALAGVSGGLVSTLLLHPLDTLKIRSAAGKGSCSQTIRILARAGAWAGLRGAYQGIRPNCTLSAFSWGLYFLSYESAKQRLSQSPPGAPVTTTVHSLAAMEAGIVTMALTNPLQVLRTRMVLCSQASSMGSFPLALVIVQREGFSALFRGFAPNLLGVTHGTLQFSLYEAMKARYRTFNGETSLRTREHICLAAASKMVASLVTYPCQVVRTVLQEERRDPGVPTPKARQVVKDLVTQGGPRSLYRGLAPHLLHVTPNVCIIFAVYESVMSL